MATKASPIPAALAPAAILKNKTPERLTSALQMGLNIAKHRLEIKHRKMILLIFEPPKRQFSIFVFLGSEYKLKGTVSCFLFIINPI
jgi:hypothetical protein